ncbi:MAG: type II toxin-antitoxin system PemK/MazF family toxin [Lentisphaerae bacterium]|jgi:mRNA interferase MazF|nr:type II toxin-antitoxin system PemK/MazF family toxin [Lentisphaerota bacterium]
MSTLPSQAGLPARGEIWLVRFNPQVGAEIEKTRPAVVVSIDAVGRLPLRIVVPVTAWSNDYAQTPWMIHLKPTGTNGLAKESAADAFQVKSVSLRRFDRRLGRVTADQLDDIVQAVALCVGT